MAEEVNPSSRPQRRQLAFEITMAGRRYARMIPNWQAAGYQVHLIFLRLHDGDLAVACC